MAGLAIGRSFSCSTASRSVLPIRSESTSPRTWSPKRCWITAVGTLPGRKPLRRTVRPISAMRALTCDSKRSAGNFTVSLRSSLPTFSTETCMTSPGVPECAPVTGAWRPPAACNNSKGWCERGDSNPHEQARWNLNPVRLPIPPLSHQNNYEELTASAGFKREKLDESALAPHPASLRTLRPKSMIPLHESGSFYGSGRRQHKR